MIWPWSSTERIQEDTKKIQEDIDVLRSGVRAYRRPILGPGGKSLSPERLMEGALESRGIRREFENDYTDAYTDEEKQDVLAKYLRRLMAGRHSQSEAAEKIVKWLRSMGANPEKYFEEV